jgi:hypothetical protein
MYNAIHNLSFIDTALIFVPVSDHKQQYVSFTEYNLNEWSCGERSKEEKT